MGWGGWVGGLGKFADLRGEGGVGKRRWDSSAHYELSFANILDRPSFKFCWSGIFSWIKLSWHSCSNQTNLDNSTDFGSFSMKSYLPLIQEDSLLIYMVLKFMWRKDFLRTSFCMRLIFRKLCGILTYVFEWLYFTQCLTSFSSINHLLSPLLTTFFLIL